LDNSLVSKPDTCHQHPFLIGQGPYRNLRTCDAIDPYINQTNLLAKEPFIAEHGGIEIKALLAAVRVRHW